jgi:hypothetical protein
MIQSLSRYGKPAVAVLLRDAGDAPDFLDDAGEHGLYCSAGERKHLAISNWHLAKCQLLIAKC